MSDRRVYIGGLLRCCIQSIRDYDGDEKPGETVIECRFEPHPATRMYLDKNSEWKWLVEEEEY